MAAPTHLSFLERTYAADEAMIHLLLLVAVHGIVKVKREVRDQIQVVAKQVALDLVQRIAGGMLPFAAAAPAVGVTTVGRVDRAETIDQPGRHRPLRRRFGGVP